MNLGVVDAAAPTFTFSPQAAPLLSCRILPCTCASGPSHPPCLLSACSQSPSALRPSSLLARLPTRTLTCSKSLRQGRVHVRLA